MSRFGVSAYQIPELDNPSTYTSLKRLERESKRYFAVKGFAVFRCPVEPRTWASAHTWCYMDLKTQTIHQHYTQDCRKCETEVLPNYDEAAVEHMAEYAVSQFLHRTGRGERPQRSYDPNRKTKKRYHDKKRCGRCKAMKGNCSKT